MSLFSGVGVGVALVTLFDAAGEVDHAGTAAHAARLVELGVAAVVVAGTTGEVDALYDAERLRLFEVRAAVPGSTGAAVVAGTGAAPTRQARALTAAARNCGVDAVLARSPRGVADPTDYYAGSPRPRATFKCWPTTTRPSRPRHPAARPTGAAGRGLQGLVG